MNITLQSLGSVNCRSRSRAHRIVSRTALVGLILTARVSTATVECPEKSGNNGILSRVAWRDSKAVASIVVEAVAHFDELRKDVFLVPECCSVNGLTKVELRDATSKGCFSVREQLPLTFGDIVMDKKR